MIKVSIIILVYNTKQYLEKCLNSVINQTLKEIEIICIDDKSTDNSIDIIKNFQKIDNRIILIENKKNMGMGYNRDVGIKIAKGEYIGFVDSDDYIDENYFYELYNTSKKYDADLTKTENIEIYNKNYERKSNLKHKNEIIEEGLYKSSINNFIISLNNYKNRNITVVTTVWSKLFKREFILKNNIMFNSIRNGEDLCFVLTVLAFNPTIAINNRAMYHCVQRNEAGVNVVNKDYIGNIVEISHESLKAYYNNNRQYIGYVFDIIMYMLFNTINELYSKERIKKEYERIYELFKNINLNKNDLKVSNVYLKNAYFKTLEKNNYEAFYYYFVTLYKQLRKSMPHFILKILRNKNIIP
ncbi:glycosyltransferase family 2 protein [Brachyspira murdochii]|uniref:Glycosyl transferase family 2 n=1 Tax=Brachyspira murdochii (strain ATCC 51284 / DSM 12563 / 56-150) TaxID=526224 RepID=D5U7X7_BRAM5|nr:glycosyltransferase family 2 protein [Brachyspira murdochii]ADG70800.1 glycosyl transferase family 2 [Brachyspira murdochii DSM 12563]